ncbi:serine O-acetyltransferase [Pseudomonas sp. GD04087]|uniref:serine O-acetyltransferase EpsC n=1 Tax=Pseudomonas TaxID=286 RepID=UPI001F15ACC0|nr:MULTISPECIES: serine O-acetyltransferase EpsC [Pseudomonas]MDH0288214.1 serine O-acetyltransferase [Pseudomonas sp. GD04087]MDH1048963.1 serine O-acetyltransferase [Pseudomonas sp. GD03903]MDH1999600.1 serine O-acetyltransferase [Pseudomonas sp. GD03691]
MNDANRLNEHGPVNWQLAQIVDDLRGARNEWRSRTGRHPEQGGRELPSRQSIEEVVERLASALFPMRLGPNDLREESEDFFVGHTLDAALNALLLQARLELRYSARQRGDVVDSRIDEHAVVLVRDFARALPEMRKLLDADVLAAYQGDPAARSVDEVLLCYPGVVAIIHHRLAHHLYNAGLPLLARIISELAHSATGIDIHPGAQIGSSFFIDHGTGVVIGETAIIGKQVRIYQAVTLGAKRFTSDETGQLHKGEPRHPIVEDEVVIYAGATILGRVTIGKGSTIGGNVWLTRSVPPGSQVSQASLQHDESRCGKD